MQLEIVLFYAYKKINLAQICAIKKGIFSHSNETGIINLQYYQIVTLFLVVCPISKIKKGGYITVRVLPMKYKIFLAFVRPEILKHEMKVFFVKYNDPIYVKLEKLDIMIRLTNQSNIAQVLAELKE